MKDNRLGGIALIIGAVSGMITMSLHPVTGAHPITPAQFEKIAMFMVGVHVLAIAGVPFSFLGALALTRRLDSPGRVAMTGLVIYGLGLVAVMIAPAMSGLVGTEIIRKMIARGPGSEQWRTLMEYNFLINQAFAKIFVVASCSAIALWSFMIVKNRALLIAVGIYGLLLGPALVIAMMTGGLSLDVHGFGLIIFGQAIWFIVAGIFLFRAHPSDSTQKVGG
ncbi:MAG TPA: hypothetical protein VNP98_18410 [Chthoniobacterales bacterium]|nr:hypothetical protein [Chthoniobacterales bacterium]